MDIRKQITDLVASGVTQSEIARIAGCSQSTISMIHVGKRGARPSAKLADGIRKAWKRHCKTISQSQPSVTG